MAVAVRARTSAVVFLALLLGTSGGGEEAERPTVVVHVTNHARASTRVLRRAEQEVSMVYRTAGVDTVWIDRTPQSNLQLPASTIDIVIMSPETEKQQRIDYRLQHDDMGYAVRPARRVYVFWTRIHDAEMEFSRDPGELLGLVAAHEVGHILLPDGGHAPHGIMQAVFDLTSRVRPCFSEDEARRIRFGLRALDVPEDD